MVAVTEAGLGIPSLLQAMHSFAKQVASASESLWVDDANSPVIDLQEGEVGLGRDLPFLILRGVGMLK